MHATPTIETKEAQLQVDLQDALHNEEMLWKSKSRNHWLATPKLNTRFFHLTTLIRRRRNCIEGLKSEDRRWLNTQADIGDYLCSNFQTLFTSSAPTLSSDISSLFTPVIANADNEFLCRIPDEAEIFTAVHSIGASKAPGLDGITSLFYQSYWAIVKFDVIATVQRFFEFGYLLLSINHTNLVLIPKNDNPTLASHFRPISLCSVILQIYFQDFSHKTQSLSSSNYFSHVNRLCPKSPYPRKFHYHP